MTLRSYLFALLAPALFGPTFIASAQVKAKITVSPTPNSGKGLRPVQLLPGHAGSLVVCGTTAEPRLDKREVALCKLDVYDRAKLGQLRSHEPLMRPHATQVMERVERFGGRTVMIATNTSAKDQTVTLMWQALDPTLTKPNYPLEELLRFEFKNMNVRGNDSLSFGPWTGQRLGFVAGYSPDSSRMLLRSPELRIDEQRGFWIFLVVDRKMNVVWNDFIRYEGGARPRLLDAVLDTAGRAVVLMSRDKGGKPVLRKDGKGSDATVETTLYTIDAQGAVATPWELLNDFYPVSARLRTLPDGRIVCGALRGGINAAGARNITGSLFAFLAPGASKFDGLVNNALPKFEKARIYPDMEVVALLRAADGFHLVGEALVDKVSISNTLTSAQKSQRTVHTYYREDLLVVRTDDAGSTKWQTVIPKSIVTPSLDQGATMATMYKNELVVFLLDDEAHIDLRKKNTEPIPQVDLKHTTTQMVTFDGEGRTRFKPVLNGEGSRALLVDVPLYWVDAGTCFGLITPSLGSNWYYPVRMDMSPDGK